jgi:hypothetical protein
MGGDVHRLIMQRGLALSLGVLLLAGGAAAKGTGCAAMGDPLVVVERLQQGFAGLSGERTAIDADGCYTVHRVAGDVALSQLRAGRLDHDQLLEARAAIDAAGFATLPEAAGDPPPVNPSILTVTLHGTTKMVGAPAGATLADIQSRAHGPAAQLTTLAAKLLELTGS